MKNLFLTTVVLFSLNVFAQENIDESTQVENLAPINLPEEVTVKSGDTKIIPLPRYTFIDRVSLEVKNALLCGEDSVRISFDGYNSQSLKVEGGMDGYRTKILVVNAHARNIEVYNNSGCKVKIKAIQVLPRRFHVNRGGHGHGHGYNHRTEAASQVSFLLESFLYLDSLVGDADRTAYLSPGKKALGKALSVLNTAPETSQASLAAIKEVISFLNASQPFIEKLATIETTFEISTEIQAVKATLERMIR